MATKQNQVKHFASWKTRYLFIPVLMFLLSGNLMAQNNLSVTFRSGANFPLKDLGTAKLTNGGGFETTVGYRFMSHLGAYAGWGWNTFNQENSSNATDLQYEETGYTFGLQFFHPFAKESKINFILGAGGIYNHIETENNDGEIIYDTGHGFGWQADAGLSIPIGHHDRWNIVPGVRYRELSREMIIEGINTKIDLNYFSVGVSLTWKLWQSK